MVNKVCVVCGTSFTSCFIGARFCTKKCKRSHFHQKYQVLHTYTCCDCKTTRTTKVEPEKLSTFTNRCASCTRASIQAVGPDNPKWRGGCSQFSPGRWGKDPAGLSWKTQRRLAWERDNYTCQECGKHRDGWKPDVHHISPWRVSQSHALINLRCLCRKCHLKEEARVQEDWGFKGTAA